MVSPRRPMISVQDPFTILFADLPPFGTILGCPLAVPYAFHFLFIPFSVVFSLSVSGLSRV